MNITRQQTLHGYIQLVSTASQPVEREYVQEFFAFELFEHVAMHVESIEMLGEKAIVQFSSDAPQQSFPEVLEYMSKLVKTITAQNLAVLEGTIHVADTEQGTSRMYIQHNLLHYVLDGKVIIVR